MTTHTWDPEGYLAFGDERARPFFDLLAQVPATAPGYVVDLGCGPGTLTAALHQRWPGSDVHGVDASAQMIARARPLARDGLSFEVADLRDFAPSRPVDVLLANASLQWVPGHLGLLESLAARLAPGGWLAFQVPGNFDSPSHTLLSELAADPRFAAHTADVAHPASHEPAAYLTRLLDLGLRAQAWETTYLHLFGGPDAVLRWVSGTGARPVLQALPARLREQFEAEYGAALREAYPPTRHGTVFPFRRIFAVAQRAS